MSRTWRRTWCRAGALGRRLLLPALDAFARQTALGTKKGLSAHLKARLEGRASTFLLAPGPQHPPPPPACSGATSRSEPARGMPGEPEVGAGEAEPQQRPPRVLGMLGVRGCLQSLLT